VDRPPRGGCISRPVPAERWFRGSLGFAVASALTALLLDVQDGPVRTVQFLVLVGLSLAVTATARLLLHADGRGTTVPGT